jgi:mRNA-degrading endonuclease RelE of RelBE toxin-antitoxin system
MPGLSPFTIVYAPETFEHLAAIDRKHHRLIEQKIVEQLSHTPEKETRNRKPLQRPTPFGAAWELRCGPRNRFRVFYEVRPVESVVWVSAIGIKDRSRLLIGNEEVNL